MGWIISVALTMASGCGSSFNWEGAWMGDHKLPAGHARNEYIENSVKRVELRLHPNATFDLSNSGITKSGSVRYSGSEATLTVEKVLGRPVAVLGPEAVSKNKPIRLLGQKNGTILFDDPAGILTDTVTLRNSAQPSTN